MKKVAILSLHLGYGGIEKCVVNLANVLCKRYDVEIAVSYQLYDKSAFFLDPRVKVIYLNKTIKPNHAKIEEAKRSKNIFKLFKEGLYALKVLYYRRKTMIHYLKNSQCDVIISTRDIFNYWLCEYGREKALKIGWEHNHFHDNYGYAKNVKNSAKNLDYLVLVSKELQEYYAKELKGSKCMTIAIPNFLEDMPTSLAPLKNKRFISVGRLSKEKGYMDLLKLYHKIVMDYPDWTLDIVGDGLEREHLEEYIHNHSLEDKVTLHGFQGKEYIDSLLHKASLYLMTSYTESFGIVLIEAMSHGLPCIAYDSAEGAREIILSGENGYLIKNRNQKVMIEKIESLMKDEKGRMKLGKQARESVHKYSSEVVGEEWYTLIEESGIYE